MPSLSQHLLCMEIIFFGRFLLTLIKIKRSQVRSNCPWGNRAPHWHHSILVKIFFLSVTCFRDTYMLLVFLVHPNVVCVYKYLEMNIHEKQSDCLRRIPLLKGRFNLNSNEEGEIHLPIRFGENEELKIAAAEIWCLDRLCQRGFPDSLAKAFGRAAIWWNILFFGQKCAFLPYFLHSNGWILEHKTFDGIITN